MTDKTVRVGDVVAWDDVPDGAYVFVNLDAERSYAMRRGDRGVYANVFGVWHDWSSGSAWRWPGAPMSTADDTIVIAVGLTGYETARELRVMAEAFEVQQDAAAINDMAADPSKT